MISRRQFVLSAVATAVSAALPAVPISFRGVPIVWDRMYDHDMWKSRTDPVYFLTDEFIFDTYGGTLEWSRLCDPNNWDVL